MDVRLLRADVFHSRLRLAAAMLGGRLPRSAAYTEMTVRELQVDSSHQQLSIARDGEHVEAPGQLLVNKPANRLTVFARHQPGR